MSDWTSVESIENIRLLFGSGHGTASLYGNGLNCVAVIISFLAMSANGPLKFSNKNINSSDISLTNYLTGEALQKYPGTGLFYTDTCYDYNNPSSISNLIEVPGGEKDDNRSNMVFYLRGKTKVEIQQQVGAMIRMPTGKTLYATKENSYPHKLDVTLERPYQYTVDDLEPVNWTQIWKKGNNSQMNAYLKMKKDLGSGWWHHELKDFTAFKGNLCYASRTTRNKQSHLFFYAPLGRQSQELIEDNAYKSSHIIKYNQEPNALTLIYATIYTPGFEDVEDFTDDILITLYDVYGNAGTFRLDYTDPIEPIIVTQNLLRN